MRRRRRHVDLFADGISRPEALRRLVEGDQRREGFWSRLRALVAWRAAWSFRWPL